MLVRPNSLPCFLLLDDGEEEEEEPPHRHRHMIVLLVIVSPLIRNTAITRTASNVHKAIESY